MSNLVRFGVSIAKDILNKFDLVIRAQNYPTRSKAIEDLIRQAITQNELSNDSSEVIGSISVVYDHHKRELQNKLTDIQHDFHKVILSSHHIHLSHHDCYETIIVKGERRVIEKLASLLKAAKGVKSSALNLVVANDSDLTS
jgi:CopG family transcriptional regulator, nickel-responsive regulator